jgi:hypothetical protein
MTAWIRSGFNRGNRHFKTIELSRCVREPLLSDVRELFGNLARVAREYGVPVTVVLIPGYDQIRFGVPCGFQDALEPIFRAQGFDVLDPSRVFCAYRDKDALFISDRHFSDLGNQILLRELVRHVQDQGSLATLGAGTSR